MKKKTIIQKKNSMPLRHLTETEIEFIFENFSFFSQIILIINY